MAGFYPDAPGRRMAYDADGSIVLFRNASAQAQWTEVNSTNKAILNSESQTNPEQTVITSQQDDQIALVFIFPELREFDGWFWASVGSGPTAFVLSSIASSSDTTNGIDGVWTTQVSPSMTNSDIYPGYRTLISSTAVNAIRGLRFLHTGISGGPQTRRVRKVHLYGEISPGETPDRLLFIDESTGLEFELPKDFGDIPRGSAREWQFRLKNNSTAAGNNLTINTIQFTAESLYLNSGAWYTFSVGGDAYAATKQIDSLAPEAESSLITGRQIIPVNEVLGLHAARIRVTHTSLS